MTAFTQLKTRLMPHITNMSDDKVDLPFFREDKSSQLRNKVTLQLATYPGATARFNKIINDIWNTKPTVSKYKSTVISTKVELHGNNEIELYLLVQDIAIILAQAAQKKEKENEAQINTLCEAINAVLYDKENIANAAWKKNILELVHTTLKTPEQTSTMNTKLDEYAKNIDPNSIGRPYAWAALLAGGTIATATFMIVLGIAALASHQKFVEGLMHLTQFWTDNHALKGILIAAIIGVIILGAIGTIQIADKGMQKKNEAQKFIGAGVEQVKNGLFDATTKFIEAQENLQTMQPN